MIYITCTMAAWDFADIYTRSPRACGPRALGVYISKIPRNLGITITYIISLSDKLGLSFFYYVLFNVKYKQ